MDDDAPLTSEDINSDFICLNKDQMDASKNDLLLE